MNLLTFLPAGEYKHKGGGEYAVPCPGCGGTDRFLVWPDEGVTGRYLCRQCGAQGDGIQFLRDFLGKSYADACAAFGLTPAEKKHGNGTRQQQHTSAAWTPKDATTPGEAWQAAAAAFLAECRRNIKCEAAAAFLQGRGRIGHAGQRHTIPRAGHVMPDCENVKTSICAT